MAVAAAVAGSSCQLLFPIHEDDSAADAQAPDAEAADQATEGAPEASDADAGPPNLLDNGDFEQGCGVSFGVYHGTPSDDHLHARTGNNCCRVCIGAGYTDFTFGPAFDSISNVEAGAGLHFRVDAWVRSAPDAAWPAQAYAVAAGYTAGFNTTTNLMRGPSVTLDGGPTWLPVTAEVAFTDPATVYIQPEVRSDVVPEGGCILVDDMSVVLVK
jgi:hypothetical protein